MFRPTHRVDARQTGRASGLSPYDKTITIALHKARRHETEHHYQEGHMPILPNGDIDRLRICKGTVVIAWRGRNYHILRSSLTGAGVYVLVAVYRLIRWRRVHFRLKGGSTVA